MQIQTNQLDPLNAVISVEINKSDYAEKVDKALQQYKKTANIPGFRKGQVPMGMIQKQYGKAIKYEEVNSLLGDNLNKYIQEQKLNILGQAMPKSASDFDLDKDDFTFEFEIGLAPQFKVDLEAKNKLVHYQIEADKKMIDEQIDRIQKHYGKISAADNIDDTTDLTIKFENEAEGINHESELTLNDIASKEAKKELKKLKIGEFTELSTKGLFKDDHQLMDFLKVPHDKAHGLNVVVKATVTNLTKTELAELNQELFDKVFPDGSVKSEKDLRDKIKEDAANQFKTIGDNKLINEVNEWLIESTKFDLPKEFLIKWIQYSDEKDLTTEQALEAYEQSEKGIRYQLIESKLFEDYQINLSFDDIKIHTANNIRKQMAQFGMMNPSDEEVDGIVQRVLSNQEELKRISNEVAVEKLSALFLDKVKAKKETITYDKFLELNKKH